jgi:hypothetical protein
VQNEHRKRTPDHIVNGIKLHKMQLAIQQPGYPVQILPFYYSSQKRITSQLQRQE